MYTQHWGLTSAPFAHKLDPRLFYESSSHEEALARLLYLVEEQRRCGILFGAGGCGKSLLLSVLPTQLRRRQLQYVLVDLLHQDSSEVLAQLIQGLGGTRRPKEQPREMWRRVADHLNASSQTRQQVVIVFDHLERAETEVHPWLERILRFVSEPGNWLTVILSLRRDALSGSEHLQEFSDLKVELLPFSRSETRKYIELMLKRGGRTESIFEPDALDVIYDSSHGVPREINRLCEMALLAGMAEGLKKISREAAIAAVDDVQALHRKRARVQARSV